MRYDVAIVGYGPVGQTLALNLGRKGHRVGVFERNDSLCGQPRAGGGDGEIMRLLQNLGVAEELEPLFQPSLAFDLVDKDFNVLRVGGDHGVSTTGWLPWYLYHQPDVEEALDKAIRELDNVDVFLGRTVVGVEQDSDCGRLFVDGPEGRSTVEAAYVIGADGARSQTREWLGVEQVDQGFEPASYVVVDIKHRDPTVEIPRMNLMRQVLDPARPHFASRWNGTEHSRCEFAVMPDDDLDAIVEPENVMKMLEQFWDIDPSNTTIVRSTIYTFRSKVAETFRAGRFFLAGDAAHLMPPFLGQGLCSGLRDMANLAWRLDLVLSGRASERVLDDYTPERKPHVEGIARASASMADICIRLDPATMDDAAREAFRTAKSADFDRKYFDGTVASGAAFAGEYFMQARVHHNGRTGKMDDIFGNGWRLISPRKMDLSALDPELRRWSSGFLEVIPMSRGRLAGVVIDIDAAYAGWFTAHGVDFVIERPDHYLFGAGKLEDLSDVLAQLRELIGTPQAA
ncbi:bifunctional 3-(3-hydroxy-phenyl)propionate/3-hydroxycinnamic acid hydroxylase [Streptomyces griseorubiginosus]|uniref:bifunctional 3-(3-hydroxy-phenyl)propionate/3-hydroxycinnamic acid hydroxylase n=1 Tax=Streptomyces griseorubiginosus TaxID=67304 RepID=UPI001AD75407|nr:bifunctional 3-(3-hydroxy-phenyl)propionate/3-hydroxycinnamic acid hydroxylase [Streptomyces griseorubiginosus]MBO4252346.1 bifunctional 3-(3-hydroxy-phenyl)propionate/3-hydroxycinnamic acid hydroxylase [Streptomyces griseorubiginosus]